MEGKMHKILITVIILLFALPTIGFAQKQEDYLVLNTDYINKNKKEVNDIISYIVEHLDTNELKEQQSIIENYYHFFNITPKRLKAELKFAGNIKRMWNNQVLKLKTIKQKYILKFYKIPQKDKKKYEMATLISGSIKILLIKLENKWKICK
jgi:hypothetical protein